MTLRERREDLVARIRLLSRVVATTIGVVVLAYWVVQIVNGPEYRQLADNNRLRERPSIAPRGVITDRHGRLLAENVPKYDLVYDREREAQGARDGLSFAARVLGTSGDEIARQRRDGVTALLAEGLTLGEVSRIELATLEHPELEIRVEQLRLYRHGEQTAHVIGYLREAAARELESAGGRFKAGDLVGGAGIEHRYDALLRGRDGEQVLVVDSRGRAVDLFHEVLAEPGRTLRLTLDLELQKEATRLLRDQTGAVVALDPRTGDVLALVSSPSYDPNVFSRRLDPRDWEKVISSPLHPLQNRAIQNTYSPGSVFKIVMAVAGLEEKILDPSERIVCRGVTQLYGRRRCWKPAGHGAVDLRDALKGSCDVYFYHLGDRLGIERIALWARHFGFGAPTGIDLEGEKPGLVPSPQWSLTRRKTPWYAGETISVAIGQGPLLTTPLQVARMMQLVAQGGAPPAPRLWLDGSVAKPPALPADPATLERLRRDLWAVVNDAGTGAAARVPGARIAGKTGTVQVVTQQTWTDSADLPYEQRDHAWFASFAPADDPELVVVVFVEHGGKGSLAAAPIARGLYEKYFANRLDTDPRGSV